MFVGLLCDTKTRCGQYDQDGWLWGLAFGLCCFLIGVRSNRSEQILLRTVNMFLGSTRDCSYKKTIRKLRECCPMTLALTLLFTLTLYHKLQRA
jgi:hypothetical protein